MTQLRKDQRLPAKHGNGMVNANLGAPAAGCAAGLIHHRDQDADRLAALKARLEEQVGVRRLNITVNEDGRRGRAGLSQAERQADGDGSLAGPALAAGNNDAHRSGAVPALSRRTDLLQSAGLEIFDRLCRTAAIAE